MLNQPTAETIRAYAARQTAQDSQAYRLRLTRKLNNARTDSRLQLRALQLATQAR